MSCVSSSTTMVSLVGAATSIIFVATEVYHDKHMFVVTKHVFCHDKSMLVATKLCFSRQNIFFATKLLAQQVLNVCPSKSFVATSLLLLWQTRVCHDKTHLLSRQKYACHDKTFVAMKMILMAAPTNDTTGLCCLLMYVHPECVWWRYFSTANPWHIKHCCFANVYIYRHHVDLVSTVYASWNALVYHHRTVTLDLVSIVYNTHICPWLSCVGELGCQNLPLENWVVRTSHWRTALSETSTGELHCQNLPLENCIVRTFQA